MEDRVTNIPGMDLYNYDDSDNVCFLCGCPRFEPYIENSHFGFPLTFQKCACGLVKQTPMPNRKFFDWFFNSDLFLSSQHAKSDTIWGFYDYLKDEPCRLATSRRRYKRLRKLFPQDQPIDILKIGPSTGSFLHVANQSGDHAIGCDISSEFVDFASRHYGVRIDHGRFEDIGYQSAQFDMILMLNVMENIPNPLQLLAETYRTLKPGGRFVFNYVEMKRNVVAAIQKEHYFLFRPPVTYIYHADVLEKMLGMNGFKIDLNLPDMRYMHLEKMLTLLSWNSTHLTFKKMGLSQLAFPIYAYPSRIVIASSVSLDNDRNGIDQ